MRLIALLILLTPLPAAAQTRPPVDWRGHGVTTGDVHRWEMERLRARSDAAEALAREQRLETRLTLRDLEAARQPAVEAPQPWRPLRSAEAERVLRESATRRSETLVRGASQIDAWLDRAPPPGSEGPRRRER